MLGSLFLGNRWQTGSTRVSHNSQESIIDRGGGGFGTTCDLASCWQTQLEWPKLTL